VFMRSEYLGPLPILKTNPYFCAKVVDKFFSVGDCDIAIGLMFCIISRIYFES